MTGGTMHLTVPELQALVAASSYDAVARELGVTTKAVQQRIRNAVGREGAGFKRARDGEVNWERKLRTTPARATVLQVLHGYGSDAVWERWGEPPSKLLLRCRT